MINGKKEVLIVAGETSGDLIGGELIKELKALYPVKVASIGGRFMSSLSDRVIARAEEISVTGIFEVIGKLGKIMSILKKVKNYITRERPHAVILIDFPDFNFRVGAHAKKEGIPVYYYVSPQVWAWRKNRVYTISSFSRKIFVIFPFEEEFYRKMGVNKVEYVGHPLVDRIEEVEPEDRKGLLGDGKGLLSLLPGSRENEIKRHLKTMVSAAEKMNGWSYYVLFPHWVETNHPRAVKGKTLSMLKISDAAVVASGTATLEAALLEVPSVVVYKVSWLSYLLGRLLVDVRFIAMPNILLGKEVFPELIQGRFTEENVLLSLNRIIQERERIKEELSKIKKMLKGGASRRVAEEVGEELWGRR